MIQLGGRTICSEIHKLIISICNKLIIVPMYIRRAIKQTVVTIEAYHFCQQCTKFYPTSCCQGKLHMQRKLLGIISVDFDSTGQLLIIYSVFVKYFRKMAIHMHQLIIEFKKAYDSVKSEVLYNNVTECGELALN